MIVRNPTYYRIKRRVHFLLHFRSSLSGTDHDKGPGLFYFLPASHGLQAHSSLIVCSAIPQLFPISSSGFCQKTALYPVCISMKTAESRLLQFPAAPHFSRPIYYIHPKFITTFFFIFSLPELLLFHITSASFNQAGQFVVNLTRMQLLIYLTKYHQRVAGFRQFLALILFSTSLCEHTIFFSFFCKCSIRPVESVSKPPVVANQLTILSVAYGNWMQPFFMFEDYGGGQVKAHTCFSAFFFPSVTKTLSHMHLFIISCKQFVTSTNQLFRPELDRVILCQQRVKCPDNASTRWSSIDHL